MSDQEGRCVRRSGRTLMGVATANGEDRSAFRALVALLVPGLILGRHLLTGVDPLVTTFTLLTTATKFA